MAVTSNMGLPIDQVSVTPGPSWAVDLELTKTLIDAHTHVSGMGVPVPTAGLNINASIPMGGFGLSSAGLMGLSNQLTTSSGSVNFLYAYGGNLYWNQGSGVPIQLTTTTGINIAGVGGITGLAGTTGAWTYSAALTTFIGTADTGKSAAVDAGAVTIRETNVLNANGIKLQSPGSLAAGYSLTLPTLPASSGVMLMNAAGTVAVSQTMMPALVAVPTAVATVTTPPAVVAGAATLYLDSLSGRWTSKTSSTASYPLYMVSKNTAEITSFSTAETIVAGGALGGGNAPDKGFRLPANSLAVGSTVRIRLYGQSSSSGATTVELRLRAGAAGTTADTLISTFSFANSAASGTGIEWTAEAIFTFGVVGASASANLGGYHLINQGTTGISTTATQVNTITANTTFASTSAHYLTATMITGNASTTVYILSGTIELI